MKCLLIRASLSPTSLSSLGHKKETALPLRMLLAPPSPPFPEVLFQLAQSTIPRRIDTLDLDFNANSSTDSKEGVKTFKYRETCKVKQLQRTRNWPSVVYKVSVGRSDSGEVGPGSQEGEAVWTNTGRLSKVFTVQVIALSSPIQPCSLALNLREEEREMERQQRIWACVLVQLLVAQLSTLTFQALYSVVSGMHYVI